MKVETDIITSITASPTGRSMILVAMFVESSKTDVIVFIGNAIMASTSHWPITFRIRVSSLIVNISLVDIKGKMYKL